MGRVGRVSTPHGDVTTPTLMPVINPSDIILSPSELRQEFGADLIMTNAYLTLLNFENEAVRLGVHDFLEYDGPIMMDSGGYQILRYGEIEVGSEEIIRFQDKIAPDIATILDVPTGAWVDKERAAETVRITLARAKQTIEIRSNPDVMWCGPVQGGTFPDLVAESASEIGKLDFQLHAIGSPVELLENYRYSDIVDLVMTAKQNLPLNRPVHLFGAGHPMVLALAVAMGCDLFDSAAYVLYARGGRYMTPEKTLRFDSLTFLPCECPICVEHSLEEMKKAAPEERVKLLARHNLHVTFGELRTIRQAIIDGRLWEHVELRCRAHPRLLDGLRTLVKYREFTEHFDPVSKPSAFFYLGPESADRPEVLRHRNRLEERFEPTGPATLVLLPVLERERPNFWISERTHLVRLIPPFGVVPEELEEIYPLGQFQVPKELDSRQIKTVVDSLSAYLQKYGGRYDEVLIFDDPKRWGNALVDACKAVAAKLKVLPLSESRQYLFF
jgi:7-cyano-7-deazaguanine tRNA-ribosyltransferase